MDEYLDLLKDASLELDLPIGFWGNLISNVGLNPTAFENLYRSKHHFLAYRSFLLRKVR